MGPRYHAALLEAEGVVVPPTLPTLLQNFAKAALRTQPPQLLPWATAYFRALAEGKLPPAASRIQPYTTKLTPARLRLLHQQLGSRELVTLRDVFDHWALFSLPKEPLQDLLELGGMAEPTAPLNTPIEWIKLLALAAGQLGDSLKETMKVLCSVLSDDGDEGSTAMPLALGVTLYTYLARIDGDIPESAIQEGVSYMKRVARSQGGFVTAYNLECALCPDLH